MCACGRVPSVPGLWPPTLAQLGQDKEHKEILLIPDNFRGVGVFHVKGWGSKSLVCSSKPRENMFLLPDIPEIRSSWPIFRSHPGRLRTAGHALHPSYWQMHAYPEQTVLMLTLAKAMSRVSSVCVVCCVCVCVCVGVCVCVMPVCGQKTPPFLQN